MSDLYISKRCPYCRKLLMTLQQRPDIKGNFNIVCIDDEPFPNVIKSVPAMIVGNEIWGGERIFAELEQSSQQQGVAGGEQQQQQQQQRQQQKPVVEEEIMGVCENGMCGFAPIEDNVQFNDSYYASIDEPEPVPLNVPDNGHGGGRSKGLDNDYERLMAERGDMMPNKRPVM
jgi:hypothetical protein